MEYLCRVEVFSLMCVRKSKPFRYLQVQHDYKFEENLLEGGGGSGS